MLVFNLILVLSISNIHIIYTLDTCSSRSTCKECIRDPSLCVWCAKDDYTGLRCHTINSTIDEKWCPDGKQNPTNSKNILKNDNFSLDPDHVIQIKPQNYAITLRTGSSEKFEFSFQAAQDFPVDLYFLLDASLTMANVKDTTAEQAENIFHTIKKMTKNVYLGFGSFVDKAVLPFTITLEPTTYSFRHHLSLTDSFTTFKKVVSSTPVGKNRDIQEGGLDALAQVMVCKEEIGWRNESRKIIVYLSDGQYHAAGDGKSAGIFQPYDGRCYTENGIYTKELEMDYPSVGMINKLAVERNMVILFFVQYDVEDIYSRLSDEIRGSKLATFQKSAKTDSTHVVKTLKDIYEQISNKITLNVKVRSGRRKSLKISFDPDCTSKNSSDNCNVQIGKEKKIVGTVKLLQFDDRKLHVDIGIESIEEKLSLEIEAIKSCECEANDKVERNSVFCNGEVKSCGICDCGSNRYGEKCACKKNSADSFADNSTCISKDSNVECSGHGSCVCGACYCMEGFSGKFCDCNMESCPRDNKGKLCSGESRGECLCGKCKCKPQWTGKACDCLKRDDDATVCNNRGKWDCNACKCDRTPDWDVRDYDENCKILIRPITHYRQCRKLESCATCQRNRNEPCTCMEKIQPRLVNKFSEEYINSSSWKVCPSIKVGLGCYSNFAYRYIDKNSTLELVSEEGQNCSETYGMFGALLLLTIVLGGVGVIMGWKFMIDARDRLECKQFLSQQDHQGNFENPLYRQPNSNFSNPAFKRSFR